MALWVPMSPHSLELIPRSWQVLSEYVWVSSGSSVIHVQSKDVHWDQLRHKNT